MTAAALLLVALMANQHRVGRAVAKKRWYAVSSVHFRDG